MFAVVQTMIVTFLVMCRLTGILEELNALHHLSASNVERLGKTHSRDPVLTFNTSIQAHGTSTTKLQTT